MKYQKIILVSLFSLFIWVLNPIKNHAQDRNQLEAQRLDIIKRIDAADKQLSTINSSKKSTINDFKILERKIKERENLLKTIQNEVVLAEEALEKNKAQSAFVLEDLNVLKEKYYALLNKAYKQNLSYNKWAFILNAKSINDSFQKWIYVKQYEAYIHKTFEQLKSKSTNVQESAEELETLIQNRQSLLEEESAQNDKIKEELKLKDKILAELKKDELNIKSELATQKKQREELNNAIESAIYGALKGIQSNTSAPTKTYKNIDASQGSLQWPVDNGFILSSYGKQKHPSLPDVYIQNNGIDIKSNIGSVANSIHEGEVVSVNKIPNYGYTVIVKHNAYYSVYSRLDKTYVEKGESVLEGQRLGAIDVDDEGRCTLHFEFWQGKTKLDPEKWLKK